jgi:type VI secretion system protein ImpF
MTAVDPELGIRLSLLDRLTDLRPESKAEGHLSPWEEMREIKAGLCRDLSALLNTRRAEADFDPEFEQATNSILTFGVADFTSLNLKSRIEQDRVRLSIERAIRQFEPRLTRVAVTVEEADALRPVLRFEVSALLRIDPGGQAVLFDATLHRDSRRIAVTGADS